ncbi:MAG: hypothetical protein CL965_02615 [Euryarchaeota archaeon]|nr:hypothetical protein [Euryarchaeota archaeon]
MMEGPTRYGLISSTTMVTLFLLSSFMVAISDNDRPIHMEELHEIEAKMLATSPGHPVFGEYVGAHWCGPCMSSASPSLDNLKNSNPEDFTFVSFFQSSSGGYPDDSPINRRNHVSAAASGIPVFSFADRQSGTCYKVGAGGTNYYDSDYSNGGCMDSDTSNYAMQLETQYDSATDQVTVTVNSMYTGSLSSVSVFLYAAITEKVSPDSYDNGVKPHHSFREWMLASHNNGFEQLTLTPNVPVENSWQVPLSAVRAGGGYTQLENFWPVFALMDGPHTTYNNFLSAVDLDMIPLVDIGVDTITISNRNGNDGFVPGDILDISCRVSNNGVEAYDGGGQLSINWMDGLDENEISTYALSDFDIGGSQTFNAVLDTTGFDIFSMGSTNIRAKISGNSGDRSPSNDISDAAALHDMPPSASQPSSSGSTSIDRGDSISFEASALSNDLVDDISTMFPTVHYSPSSNGMWSGDWVTDIAIVGAGDNARFSFEIDTPLDAELGNYDLRVQWTDAAGQTSDWLTAEEAFYLQNSLPRVLGNGDMTYAGVPTVKVGTSELVSVVGLISDAETPLFNLDVHSSEPEFIAWNPSSLEIEVRFDDLLLDSQGSPIPQGMQVTVNDGDESNTGLMMFNVVENGAPRWSPIPIQSFHEGGSASLGLTDYLSDTNNNGQVVPVSGVTVEILSVSDNSLVEASIFGQTINVNSLDDDSNGVVEISLRASDGSKSSDTTVTFYVLNVNDAPRIDSTDIDELTIKMGESIDIDLISRVSDIDDSDEEIWITASSYYPGAVFFDPISGIMEANWPEAGSDTVKITAEDRHGASTTISLSISIVDDIPLEWDENFEVQIDSSEIGSTPTVEITNIGGQQLDEIRVTWTVCNKITGICHSAGSSFNLGPFIILPASGNGLSAGDYFTLSVQGVDENGFDRRTSEQKTFDAVAPGEGSENGLSDSNPDEGSGDSQFSIFSVGAYAVILVSIIGAILVVTTIARNRISPSQKSLQNPLIQNQEPMPPLATNPLVSRTSNPPPPPPMTPPLPPGGLPPGWSMEQWHYYGEEYLSRYYPTEISKDK